MKNINKIIYFLIVLVTFSSCDNEADTVASIRGTNGVIVNIKNNSTGTFLGSPESGVEMANAMVTISDAQVDLVVSKVSGDMDGVSKMQLVKSLNGGTEILVTEGTSFPLTATASNITELIAGLGVDANDLRIGDKITYKVITLKANGDKFYFDANMGEFSVTLNCSYDLAGSYTMTNSVCGSEETVVISQNTDGTWHLTHADGGLLNFCSSNDIKNPGDIAVSCGGTVEHIGVAYCEGGNYGIGCIAGGIWNQDSGTLVLDNTNAFFGWADAEYTSTYVKQ